MVGMKLVAGFAYLSMIASCWSTEFTQENFEKFLVDRSFPLAEKIGEMNELFHKDEKGKYLDYEVGLARVQQEATDMIDQIIDGTLLSSEPDWKQATVMISLSVRLYAPGSDARKVHKVRDLAFARLVRSYKCLPETEAVELQTVVATYLRYINSSIQKEQEDIFYLYRDADSFKRLWEVFCNELEGSLLNLKKARKKKYLTQIKKAEDEIVFFQQMCN